MNTEFIIVCINIVEKIKLNSIVAITKGEEKLKYQLNYVKEYEMFELTCLDEEDTIWNDGNSIEEIKEDLICSAIRGMYQGIELIS